jgi:hypothetical protein
MNFFECISQYPTTLVGWSALLATFIASVIGAEQDERLRNGTFGAVAGTSVGGLAAIITKDQTLLLVGVFGSALGAILGWVTYLWFCFLAAGKSRWGRPILEFQTGGLKSVRDKLERDDQELLRNALNTWSQNFRSMILREAPAISENANSSDYDTWSEIAIRGWLTSLVDTFNLVLDAVADKEEYRARITLIVFGKKREDTMGKDVVIGQHWISYSGRAPAHKSREFHEDSIAFKVANGDENSPCLVSPQSDKKEENRATTSSASYASYMVFRLSDDAVLSMDWPGRKITDTDPYVSIARALIHQDVAPTLAGLLAKRTAALAAAVKLSPRG